MTDSISPELLNFLSEPRSLKEIAKHLGISSSTAGDYLQKAFEQNLILICRFQRNTGLKAQKEQRLHETLFYISRDSHLLPKGLTGFNATRILQIREVAKSKNAWIKFSSKDTNKASFSSVNENASDSLEHELGSKTFPKIGKSKEKMARNVQRPVDIIYRPLTRSQARTFSAAEKLSMLKALSRKSLSYLDLHVRFNVSKQVIGTFVKNGLIKETWGSENIGVRLLLTEKGEKQLRRLKMASMLEKDKVRKATIQLKYKIP